MTAKKKTSKRKAAGAPKAASVAPAALSRDGVTLVSVERRGAASARPDTHWTFEFDGGKRFHLFAEDRLRYDDERALDIAVRGVTLRRLLAKKRPYCLSPMGPYEVSLIEKDTGYLRMTPTDRDSAFEALRVSVELARLLSLGQYVVVRDGRLWLADEVAG